MFTACSTAPKFYKINFCSVKAKADNAGNPASCSMKLLRMQPSLPAFALARTLFCLLSLSFKSSLHQRFMMTLNGCRESCSGVNCSVSARLKAADGVACNSACRVFRGQFENIRHVTCYNSQSACNNDEYRAKERRRSILFF